MIILLVGAHPDDIEIGAGATIHKLHARHVFHGLVFTSGGLRGSTERREAAIKASAQIVGYCPSFARLQDGSFSDVEAERIVFEKIEALNPDIVIGHSGRDNHRDHFTAYIATLSAARKVRNVLFFEGPYTRGFCPHLFVSVTRENLEAKIRALREHSSALAIRYPYLESDNVQAQAKQRGLLAGHEFAEAFEVGMLVDLGII